MSDENTSFFDEESLLHGDDLTNDEFNVTVSPCILSPSSLERSSNINERKDMSSSDDNDDGIFMNSKSKQSQPRTVYLVTYSKADVLKIQSRKQFAEIVAEQFNRNGNIVLQWASSVELHREEGVHYHLAIKLKAGRRFKQVKQNIHDSHGINLDFSEWHDNYYSAYTYATKFDSHFETSEGHPVLFNPPRTAAATSSKRKSASVKRKILPSDDKPSIEPLKKKEYKLPRLNNEAVAKIILDNNVRSEKELCALAKTQAKEGKHDLQSYLYKHPNIKYRNDLIATVWKIEESEADIAREKKTLLQILEEARSKPCSVDKKGNQCKGSWIVAALETLSRNSVSRQHFSSLVLNSLNHGRGKGRNFMICGPANCAKSFMLMPLTEIYRCFVTPSQGSYNWVEAPEKEVIFLNDLRYEKDGEKTVMPWNMFLNLLEGAPVNILLTYLILDQVFIHSVGLPAQHQFTKKFLCI